MISLEQAVSHTKIDNSYSPDLMFLERNYSYVPVFIYGTMQKNFSAADVMEKFPRIGQGVTEKTDFKMFICDHEPVVLDNTEQLTKHPIFGEIYIVPNIIIRNLDATFCRGIHFTRRLESIIYTDPALSQEDRKKTPLYKSDAYIYVGIADEWKRFLKANPESAHVYKDEGYPCLEYYRFTFYEDKANIERNKIEYPDENPLIM